MTPRTLFALIPLCARQRWKAFAKTIGMTARLPNDWGPRRLMWPVLPLRVALRRVVAVGVVIWLARAARCGTGRVRLTARCSDQANRVRLIRTRAGLGKGAKGEAHFQATVGFPIRPLDRHPSHPTSPRTHSRRRASVIWPLPYSAQRSGAPPGPRRLWSRRSACPGALRQGVRPRRTGFASVEHAQDRDRVHGDPRHRTGIALQRKLHPGGPGRALSQERDGLDRGTHRANRCALTPACTPASTVKRHTQEWR